MSTSGPFDIGGWWRTPVCGTLVAVGSGLEGGLSECFFRGVGLLVFVARVRESVSVCAGGRE